jgi:hypothetical protein
LQVQRTNAIIGQIIEAIQGNLRIVNWMPINDGSTPAWTQPNNNTSTPDWGVANNSASTPAWSSVSNSESVPGWSTIGTDVSQQNDWAIVET